MTFNKIEPIKSAKFSDLISYLKDKGKDTLAKALEDMIKGYHNSRDYGQFENLSFPGDFEISELVDCSYGTGLPEDEGSDSFWEEQESKCREDIEFLKQSCRDYEDILWDIWTGI